MGFDLTNQIQIDDGRTVHALEFARIEALFHILHRLAEDQRIPACIDTHIIASRVDPLDAINVNSEDLALILDIDQLFKAICRRRTRSIVAAKRSSSTGFIR